jgi:hypothetical protein
MIYGRTVECQMENFRSNRYNPYLANMVARCMRWRLSSKTGHIIRVQDLEGRSEVEGKQSSAVAAKLGGR